MIQKILALALKLSRLYSLFHYYLDEEEEKMLKEEIKEIKKDIEKIKQAIKEI